jgi:predicted house-cleaning noncanonical NTP pyrophosphatase (MazG superfamily)
MTRQTFTLNLKLSDRAAKIYKEAEYAFNDRFTNELAEQLAECIDSRKFFDLDMLVEDVAQDVAAAEEFWREEQRQEWEMTVLAAL